MAAPALAHLGGLQSTPGRLRREERHGDGHRGGEHRADRVPAWGFTVGTAPSRAATAACSLTPRCRCVPPTGTRRPVENCDGHARSLPHPVSACPAGPPRVPPGSADGRRALRRGSVAVAGGDSRAGRRPARDCSGPGGDRQVRRDHHRLRHARYRAGRSGNRHGCRDALDHPVDADGGRHHLPHYRVRAVPSADLPARQPWDLSERRGFRARAARGPGGRHRRLQER